MLPDLKNSLIHLSKISVNDSELIYDAVKHSQNEIAPWATWLHSGYQCQDTLDYIDVQRKNWQEGIEYGFTIKSLKGTFLGVISLHIFDCANDVASIGYWIDSRQAGNGYCTKAVKLLVKKAFQQLNLIRIELVIGINNIPSQKVAKKSGATFEAILKNRIRPQGMISDAHVYAFYVDNI